MWEPAGPPQGSRLQDTRLVPGCGVAPTGPELAHHRRSGDPLAGAESSRRGGPALVVRARTPHSNRTEGRGASEPP